jgi:hypothetical protein
LVVGLEELKLRIAACKRPLSASRDAAPAAALAAAPFAAAAACMARPRAGRRSGCAAVWSGAGAGRVKRARSAARL